MKKVFMFSVLFLVLTLVGCSATDSKWTFSNNDYEILLRDAKEVKSNYDMYVEKENRGLDYSKELEDNIEIANLALDNAIEINEKYNDKLTKEESTMLADMRLAYRYIRNNFDSSDELTVDKIDILQEKILKLEEE